MPANSVTDIPVLAIDLGIWAALVLACLAILAVCGPQFVVDLVRELRELFGQAGDDAGEPRFLVTSCRHRSLNAFVTRTEGLKTIFCRDCKRGLTRREAENGLFTFEETDHDPVGSEADAMGIADDVVRKHLGAATFGGGVH